MLKIFADGADELAIAELAKHPRVEGFTTNPSLLRAAGVTDYAGFARRVLRVAGDRPVSFEVLADEPDEMERQALVIASWGPSAVVKIPVINTEGKSMVPLANRLAANGVAVNVTAVLLSDQVEGLELNDRSFVSVFAGRIADVGGNPAGSIEYMLQKQPQLRIIWASPRELRNVFDAHRCHCYAITLTRGLIDKLPLFHKNLVDYALETVQGLYGDAIASGLTI